MRELIKKVVEKCLWSLHCTVVANISVAYTLELH